MLPRLWQENTKVEGRGAKSLDFQGPGEVLPSPLRSPASQQPVAVVSCSSPSRTRWVPPRQNREVQDVNEVIFRRVRG